MENNTVGRANRSRDAELAGRRAVDDARTVLEAARRSVGVLRSQIRPIMGQRGNTAEAGHRAADALQEVSEARFQAELRDYLPALRTVVSDAPDPLPPGLVAAYVTARLGDELFGALHGAIAADVDDPSTATFEVAAEADVNAAIAAKHAEVRVAEARVTELEDELRRAEAEYDAACEGR